MDVSKEMELASSELGKVLQNQAIKHSRELAVLKRVSSNDYALSDMAMDVELHQNNTLKPNEARNFYDYTKNAETKTAFMGKYSMDSTMAYRERFKNDQDPISQQQVRISNDTAYRNMFVTHKAELMNVDPELKSSLAKQHTFESNYLAYREAKDDPKIAIKEVMALREKVQESFQGYKADKLGYKGVDNEIKNTAPNIKVNQPAPKMERKQAVIPTPQSLHMAQIQKRMMSIRTKSLAPSRSL